MFTVKVIRASGVMDVFSCDRFSHETESPVEVSIFVRGVGFETIRMQRGDSVFIENLSGKTISAVRPPRDG